MTGNAPSAPRGLQDFVAAELGRDLDWRRLAGDGSDRVFWRLSKAGQTWVAADGSGLAPERRPENRAFLMIGRHLAGQGLPVARILAHRVEAGYFLLEDLGDELLARKAVGLRPPQRLNLYGRVIDLLLELQTAGARGFDPAWCAQTPVYDRATILEYESAYFFRAFVRGYAGLEVDWADLAEEFEFLARQAAAARPRIFLHRDFQSRNLMLQDQRLRIIDYQGSRLGPAGYDLASLLIDPYVGLSGPEQEELLSHYLRLAAGRGLVEPREFRRDYEYLALQRNFQMLGAFAFLSARGRPGFKEHIPAALRTLRNRSQRPEFNAWPRLRELIARLEHPGEG